MYDYFAGYFRIFSSSENISSKMQKMLETVKIKVRKEFILTWTSQNQESRKRLLHIGNMSKTFTGAVVFVALYLYRHRLKVHKSRVRCFGACPKAPRAVGYRKSVNSNYGGVGYIVALCCQHLKVNKGMVTGGCDATFISSVRVQEFRDWLAIGNLLTPIIVVVGWNNLKHPFGNRPWNA